MLKKLKLLKRKLYLCYFLTITSLIVIFFFSCMIGLEKDFNWIWHFLGAIFLIIAFFSNIEIKKIIFQIDKTKADIIQKIDSSVYYDFCYIQLKINKIKLETRKKGINYWLKAIFLALIILFSTVKLFPYLVNEKGNNIFLSFLICLMAVIFSFIILDTIFKKYSEKELEEWKDYAEIIWEISQNKKMLEMRKEEKQNDREKKKEKEIISNRIFCKSCGKSITDYSKSLNYCSICINNEKN